MAIFEKKKKPNIQLNCNTTYQKSVVFFSFLLISFSLSLFPFINGWKASVSSFNSTCIPGHIRTTFKRNRIYIYIIFSSTYFKSFFTRKTLVEKKIEKSEERIIDAVTANPLSLAIYYLRRNGIRTLLIFLSFSFLFFPSFSPWTGSYIRSPRFFDRILSKWTASVGGIFQIFRPTLTRSQKSHTRTTRWSRTNQSKLR